MGPGAGQVQPHLRQKNRKLPLCQLYEKNSIKPEIWILMEQGLKFGIFSQFTVNQYPKFHILKRASFHLLFRGRIHYSEMYDMLKNMDPPLGFGSKCPDRLAYKKLIRMNMPLDQEGKVNFTTTLFALIRENLSIKMRAAEEMDQADVELRETILKVWPFTAKEKIELLVPTTRGNKT